MPDQIRGLYLVGSLALGDYRPGQSDIDFIAIAEPNADMSPLVGVHRTLSDAYPTVNCDGIYLGRGDLAYPPTGTGPSAMSGVVTFDSAEERHPVTWLTMLRHGITVRGEAPSASWIAADEDAAVVYSRQNLQSYWLPWLNQRRRDMATLQEDESVIWGCLGVARLHAAIVTGKMVSKSGAGRHALANFPDDQAIVEEAIWLRQGGASRYNSPTVRGDDLVAFMDRVISSTVL
ncbi:hypothetical protein J2Y55_003708 [Bosea sp. BE125]|uniref:nucleotidyltransferase domain-containing protein n=1 Tax=Bosea sp. BE125 TaxID=2817909 RepID=UPI00285DB639|nr:nucleotidyltransferase domain-containing protein [Bosea sp. BE125]MDR6872689.1 hypothetical protein [Bosea sp. BE125]